MPNRPTDYSDLNKARARLGTLTHADRIAVEAVSNGLIKVPDADEVRALEPLAETPEEKSVIKYFATGGNVPHSGHYITIQGLRAKHIQKLKEIQKMRSVQQIVKTDGQSVLEFNGHKIHFDVRDGVVMVNATQTAKPYGKDLSNFIRLQPTIEYMDAIRENHGSEIDLVVTEKGGSDNGGTWLHHKLALRFAGWLDVKLQIWMDEKIESLLRGETVSLRPQVEPKKLTVRQATSEYKAAVSLAKLVGFDGMQAHERANRMIRNRYGVDVCQEIGLLGLPSPDQDRTLIATELGQRLGGLSAQAVNKLLADAGLQFRNEEGHWQMTATGRSLGVLTEVARANSEGTSQQLRWRESVLNLLRDKEAS